MKGLHKDPHNLATPLDDDGDFDGGDDDDDDDDDDDVFGHWQVIIMMVTIMSVFGICWLPFQVAILYNEHRPDSHLPVTVDSFA